MKETEWQGLLVKTAKERGAFARKLSHRFLVGVPDLLIKLPEFPALLCEAKRQQRKPARTKYKLEVTGPQARFLNEADDAGLRCGIWSVIEDYTNKAVWFRFFDWSLLDPPHFPVLLSDHSRFLMVDRKMGLWNELVRYFRETSP